MRHHHHVIGNDVNIENGATERRPCSRAANFIVVNTRASSRTVRRVTMMTAPTVAMETGDYVFSSVENDSSSIG